jgi:hypothetical protein
MASRIRQWFLGHPASVGESYSEHFGVAARFGFAMLRGGIACLVHALFPAVCERTGSGAVKALYSEMVARQPGNLRPAYDEPDWRPEYEI